MVNRTLMTLMRRIIMDKTEKISVISVLFT